MYTSIIEQSRFTPIEAFPWVVKLAETPEEFIGLYRLRYEVFALERQNVRLMSENGIERDDFDQWCDHLIVKNQLDGKVVGTYRFLPGERALNNRGFYSETEFDFSRSDWKVENVLELGRSCVDGSHRNGRVLQLLWEGIMTYLQGRPYEFLIGCASMPVPNLHELNTLITWMKEKQIIRQEKHIRPHATHRIHNLVTVDILSTDRELFRKLPPLLKGYLSLGAYIACDPAYDPMFDTIDFLIVMPRMSINQRYLRRMSGGESINLPQEEE